jgi:hypothetical protein
MLDGLKRLFGTAGVPVDWEPVVGWAQGRQLQFRAVGTEGFVLDGTLGASAWRLEWGPSQRPYIAGQELRIRSELGLAPELQVVLMNRALQEKMEKDVFEQYVEGVQTRIDNQTPPEMRWLVMYPKLPGSEMPELRERFVALASSKGWLQRWLAGPLTQALAAVRFTPETPVVLMIGRGRLMLRTAQPEPEVAALQGWLRMFEAAMREALRAASEAGEGPSTTGASQWHSSALPGDERLK